MNSRMLGALPVTAFFAVGLLCGQTGQQQRSTQSKSTDVEDVQKDTKKTPSGAVKSEKVTVVGKVTKFNPGKTLELQTLKHSHRRFDLSAKNETVNGTENIKVGDMVQVQEFEVNGQKTIAVAPYTAASNTTGSNAGTTAGNAEHGTRTAPRY